MSNNLKFTLVMAFAVILGCGYAAILEVVQTKREYSVLREVAQMKLQGQNNMEIVMNVKTTDSVKEIHAALDQLTVKE